MCHWGFEAVFCRYKVFFQTTYRNGNLRGWVKSLYAGIGAVCIAELRPFFNSEQGSGFVVAFIDNVEPDFRQPLL